MLIISKYRKLFFVAGNGADDLFNPVQITATTSFSFAFVLWFRLFRLVNGSFVFPFYDFTSVVSPTCSFSSFSFCFVFLSDEALPRYISQLRIKPRLASKRSI